MRTRALFSIFVILALHAIEALAAPVDLSAPGNSLGSANAHGYLRIWREIDELDFGNDFVLPLRIQFSTERQDDSPYLGRGWWCPLLSATAYLKREKMMRAELLCGKIMYLRRDKADPNKFQSLDKEWTGAISGDKITISRADGWELHYMKGAIQQLRTDTGRVLTWVRKGNLVTEIREEGSSAAPFKLSGASSGVPNGFFINGKLHSFELDNRPTVQTIAGQRLVKELAPSLSAWTWPDGTKETYLFEVSKDVVPNLKITDKEARVSAYTWDAATNQIVSEQNSSNGDWIYNISPVKGEFDLPRLERTNKKREMEFLAIDSVNGIIERKTLRDGHTITHMFKAPGPLYDKVRKVEKIENGLQKTVYQAGYDAKGRLVREIDERGWQTTFGPDEFGKQTTSNTVLVSDPALQRSLEDQERLLLKKLEDTKNSIDRDSAAQDLFLFYISKALDFQKAKNLLGAVSDSERLFNLKLALITANPNLAIKKKKTEIQGLLDEFPNKKAYVENIISDIELQ